MKSTYDEVYARWRDAPESFWAEAAEAIHWYKKWDRVLDASRPPFYRWFTGGMVNTCYNALDRHVEQGRGNQPALIYDSPVTGTIKTFSYRELLDQVARFAGVLAAKGFRKETGSSSICRWCRRRSLPCWPVPGLGRFTRSSSEVLPPMSWPVASMMRNLS